MTNAVTLRALQNPRQIHFQAKRRQGSSRVEAEGAGGGEGSLQLWEGQRKDGSPEKVGRDSESHANFSMREGEYLC